MNIIEHFLAHVRMNPGHPAIIEYDRVITYSDVARTVTVLVEKLKNSGLQHGDRCVIQVANGALMVELLLAAAEVGIVLAPVATSLPVAGVKKALHSTKSNFLITGQPLVEHFSDIHVLQLDQVQLAKSRDSSYEALGQTVMSRESPYILTMTSGSTGEPKPILLTQKTKLKRIFKGTMELYGLKPGERVLVASPIYHSLGMRLSLLPLLTGGTAIIIPRFSPGLWLEAVKKYAVGFTIAVSTHLERLAPLLESKAVDLKSMHTLVSSSARLHPDIKALWFEHFNGAFHECYGTSEVGIVTNLSPEDSTDYFESVGRPLSYVDIKIIGKNGQPCATGEVGEIACKTETIFSGYWNKKEETRQAFYGDYFLTGDLGYLDEAGYLYLSGRKKEVIQVGGISVFPKDIEQVLMTLTQVAEVAVIGMPDEKFGEKIIAFVVLQPEVEWDEFALRQVCMQQLADYQQPRIFKQIEQLPRNDVGKINKLSLQDMKI